MLMVMMVAATMTAQQPLEGPPIAAQFDHARDRFNLEMIDYQSARFRDVHADRRRICGYVNGKNRLGAYAGWKRFVIMGVDGAELTMEGSEDFPGLIAMMCDGNTAPPTSRDYSDRLKHW